MEGHLSGGVGGAGEAGVVAADSGFDAVEETFGDIFAVDVVFGDLGDGFVHGQVVLARGDDQVHLLDEAVVVYFVVVEEGATGGFADADRF
ncbi:MAG: hypothetical protein RJA01_651 [Actinomycetota bacterium]